jgi:oligogalacturonide lyase
MVFMGTTKQGRKAFTVDLRTLAIEQIGDGNCTHEVVAPRRRELFFRRGNAVYATHLDSHMTRKVAEISDDWTRGRGFSVNADETLLVGCYAKGEAEYYKKPRSHWFVEIYQAKLPNAIYTIEIETGKTKVIYRENTWLGHVQFSPTDPTLLMFCHEGPWHHVDRIWLIRTDGTGRKRIHTRTVKHEIWGHEFWGPRGKRVWFDLQIPRGQTFYLAGADIATGKEIRYRLMRDQWCVHYNISADGAMFCGDGGGRGSVAGARDGKWIYLFRLDGRRVKVERLCSLANHDYTLEPNVHFTPDGKWVVFRSNMHGSCQVYAVEVAPSKTQP